MTQCIYSRVELNDVVPPNDCTKSREHIVPWSIGGSNQFSTWDVSKRSNNDFGRDIDAPFINLLPIAIKRHRFSINGYSGAIPDIELRAKSLDNNEPATIIINANGEVDFRFETTFIREDKATHSSILLGAPKARAYEILDGLLAKARKTGQSVYSFEGAQISSIEDYERVVTVEESTSFKASVVAFDFEVWVRGIFKMLLGLGHTTLGPTWTFGLEGDRFRSVLIYDRKDWPSTCLSGFTTGRLPEDLAATLGISDDVRKAGMHTLAILPGEIPTGVVSLFGGDGIPEAIVTMGRAQGNLAVVNDRMDPSLKVGVRINPRNREVSWITVRDLDANASRLADY